MITVSLRDFLTHAKLGPIKPGVTQDAVRTWLGPPTDVSVQNDPQIWKYGSLFQFAFQQTAGGKELNFLGLYFLETPTLIPTKVQLEGWWPEVGGTIAQFQQFAQNESIALRKDSLLTYDDQATFLTDYEVRITFGLLESGTRND
jgi:hypothetical protein